jgi:hypothetical protein
MGEAESGVLKDLVVPPRTLELQLNDNRDKVNDEGKK